MSDILAPRATVPSRHRVRAVPAGAGLAPLPRQGGPLPLRPPRAVRAAAPGRALAAARSPAGRFLLLLCHDARHGVAERFLAPRSCRDAGARTAARARLAAPAGGAAVVRALLREAGVVPRRGPSRRAGGVALLPALAAGGADVLDDRLRGLPAVLPAHALHALHTAARRAGRGCVRTAATARRTVGAALRADLEGKWLLPTCRGPRGAGRGTAAGAAVPWRRGGHGVRRVVPAVESLRRPERRGDGARCRALRRGGAGPIAACRGLRPGPAAGERGAAGRAVHHGVFPQRRGRHGGLLPQPHDPHRSGRTCHDRAGPRW